MTTLQTHRTLGQAIQATMDARHVHAAEAARQMGVSATQLSRWRRDFGTVSMPHLARIAAWMGTDVGSLQVLAGYPAPNGSEHNPTSSDPLLLTLTALWPRLDERDRSTLVKLAQVCLAAVLMFLKNAGRPLLFPPMKGSRALASRPILAHTTAAATGRIG